jgi:hypothetical protein
MLILTTIFAIRLKSLFNSWLFLYVHSVTNRALQEFSHVGSEHHICHSFKIFVQQLVISLRTSITNRVLQEFSHVGSEHHICHSFKIFVQQLVISLRTSITNCVLQEFSHVGSDHHIFHSVDLCLIQK